MISRTQIAEVFHKKEITTTEMRNKVDDWYNMYLSKQVPSGEDDHLRLPYTVVNKLYKAIFAEYEAESDNEVVQAILDALNEHKKRAMQQSLIAGEAWLKPYFEGDKIRFNVVTRDNVVVFGRNSENKVTDVATCEEEEARGSYYKLLERRWIEDGKLNIDTRLYASDDRDSLGHRVPLYSLDKYANIEDLNVIPIDHIGLIAVTCPAENCVDGSDEAVSVYAAAEQMIHSANENEHQLKVEFEHGESKVFVSSDILKGGKIQDDIFTALDDDPENVGIDKYSPALRETSYLVRKNSYLRDVETLIGIKHGILSDVDEQAKTATEITSSAGDYSLSVIDFQEAFEKAVREAVDITLQLAGIYGVARADVKPEDIVIAWGNGVLYDRDKTKAEYINLAAAGLIKPEIAVAFFFDIKWKDESDLEKVRTDYMPAIQQLTDPNA